MNSLEMIILSRVDRCSGHQNLSELAFMGYFSSSITDHLRVGKKLTFCYGISILLMSLHLSKEEI